MWYFKFSFPFLYWYFHFLYLYYQKINTNYLFLNLKNIINLISFNITLVNMRKSYALLLSNLLDVLINLFETLPVIFKFCYKYRKFRYIEICVIRFSIISSKKNLYLKY
jgi:hypothetical protein